jgi:hypothetical protein
MTGRRSGSGELAMMSRYWVVRRIRHGQIK